MSWTLREIGRLLGLAEAGALNVDELQRAATTSPLHPDRDRWLVALDRLFAFAGAVLLALAVIFFFAWNWAEMHRFVKLGLVLAVFSAATGTAFFSAPFGVAWRAALLAAGLTVGAGFALIGQIYQTGADPWQLFVLWSMLMLPFAILGRSSAGWALWLAVANSAMVLAVGRAPWLVLLGAPFDREAMLFMAAVNIGVLLLFERLGERLLVSPRRHLPRLAALAALAPLTIGGVAGWWAAEWRLVTLAFCAVGATGFWVYYRLRRDLVVLALVLFAAMAVATSGVARLLPDGAGFILHNLLAVGLIAGSAYVGKWLMKLYREAQPLP